jgi:diguanylate cyclase (GGDEF)-like protein
MTTRSLDDLIATLRDRWQDYREAGSYELFVEFGLALNSLAEQLGRLRLPGLVRQCEGLESVVLALFGNAEHHPIGESTMVALSAQVEAILAAISAARPADVDKSNSGSDREAEWIKPRSIWLIAPAVNLWAAGLARQLAYYGFRVHQARWGTPLPDAESPFAVLFLPASDGDASDSINRVVLEQVARVRARCPASQLLYVGVPRTLDTMVGLMRAGIDITVQHDQQMASALSRILDLVDTRQYERLRVLIVEDSRLAVEQIQRAFKLHDIDSHAIFDPAGLFDALDRYQPDLVLMDMYLPTCNGVMATRALRQLPAYQSIPLIYLSGETDIGLQVEALRLGGDQFMTKPFNPVLLAATVKTTVERHREMQRGSRHDGLTGLLNHTAAKSMLDCHVAARQLQGRLCVAMIDIDHFKTINDTYGHPVGDQVIRSLGWLLKGRLRTSDLVGRYGGEEFLVAILDTDIQDARAVLDRIRDSFAAMPHAHLGGEFHVSFSCGIAAFPGHESATDLIQAADDALLEAKRTGRNRIVIQQSTKERSGSPPN